MRTPQKLHIAQKCADAGGPHRIRHKAHDAQRRKVNDPGHHFGNGCRNIIKASLCSITSTGLQSNSQNDCPTQNTDIVGIHQRRDRIVHDTQDQIMKHLYDAARRSQFGIRRHLKRQCSRKQERHDHPYQRGAKGSDDIELHDRLHAAAGAFLSLCHGIHDKEEHQHRRHAFQRFDEKISKNFNDRNGRREKYRNDDADDKSHGDLLDKRYPPKGIFNLIKQNTPLLP